ncbi:MULTISPECIES: hypothetical protein [unclassified Janthinobacterium]|uniref:hypothetical protein n=1 Tax=unclassified Janthinobacterium TaxID=2610881 RepID=UPI001612522D|nr:MULTISPECIES: hypothetical protein [unclassified Janthinobacterium]MBB5610584.1 dTDP-4-amino-4,6-dideoxygalactose transaminase [Janthinobacterium sp. S3T4]MBB5615962.1 dTDP-4-amino-4,6-dideoxygalactose transaminase [Janthinobacterium sp. S3M3]
MNIENGTRHHCVHEECTTLSEHLKRTSAESYVERFENEFDNYVGGIASVIALSGTAAARPSIQALVNAYHDLGRIPSPLTVPSPAHFSTLQMFVLITGASLAHSGEDESLKILELGGAA